jgi:Zn ribbon nucleic-acid-binding protein
MLADCLCPECHGRPALLLVRKDRLVKSCVECGHRWNEEREERLISEKGYVRR